MVGGRCRSPSAGGRKVSALGRRTRPGGGATARRGRSTAQAARGAPGRTDRRVRRRSDDRHRAHTRAGRQAPAPAHHARGPQPQPAPGPQGRCGAVHRGGHHPPHPHRPLYFLLGHFYGDAVIRWLEKKGAGCRGALGREHLRPRGLPDGVPLPRRAGLRARRFDGHASPRLRHPQRVGHDQRGRAAPQVRRRVRGTGRLRARVLQPQHHLDDGHHRAERDRVARVATPAGRARAGRRT